MVPSNGISANGVKARDERKWRFVTSSPRGGAAVSGSPILRSVVPCLIFLFVYGINDRVRILPRARDVQCVTLYNVSALEVTLFSFAPHRTVSSVQHIVLDVLAALPYLLHYLIPVLFPVYLCAARRADHVAHFFRLLGCSMWAHYAIWFLLPTAPPWVYDSLPLLQVTDSSPLPKGNSVGPPGSGSVGDSSGVNSRALEHREGCAFARLDQWTGLPLFYTIFNGNPVPFASFPSGHVAWPMCVLLSLPAGIGCRRTVGLYIAWVSWATMYSCHHYLLDIVAALAVTLLCQQLVNGYGMSNNNNSSNSSCCNAISCCWPLIRWKKRRTFTRCCPPDVVVYC